MDDSVVEMSVPSEWQSEDANEIVAILVAYLNGRIRRGKPVEAGALLGGLVMMTANAICTDAIDEAAANSIPCDIHKMLHQLVRDNYETIRSAARPRQH